MDITNCKTHRGGWSIPSWQSWIFVGSNYLATPPNTWHLLQPSSQQLITMFLCWWWPSFLKCSGGHTCVPCLCLLLSLSCCRRWFCTRITCLQNGTRVCILFSYANSKEDSPQQRCNGEGWDTVAWAKEDLTAGRCLIEPQDSPAYALHLYFMQTFWIWYLNILTNFPVSCKKPNTFWCQAEAL